MTLDELNPQEVCYCIAVNKQFSTIEILKIYRIQYDDSHYKYIQIQVHGKDEDINPDDYEFKKILDLAKILES